MFSLTLLDHLRLTFGQVIHQHKAHTQSAQSDARWNRRLRGSEALLMGGVTVAALAAAFGQGPVYAAIAASLAAAALTVLLVHLTFDFDASSHAHEACSVRLWHIRERYRSLLSDLQDGVIDVDDARRRRDALTEELRAIYEQAPHPASQAYQAARRSLANADEADLSEEEIDLFLPKSLHKTEKCEAS